MICPLLCASEMSALLGPGGVGGEGVGGGADVLSVLGRGAGDEGDARDRSSDRRSVHVVAGRGDPGDEPEERETVAVADGETRLHGSDRHASASSLTAPDAGRGDSADRGSVSGHLSWVQRAAFLPDGETGAWS